MRHILVAGKLLLLLVAFASAAQVPCDYDNPEGCSHHIMAQPPPVGESPEKTSWPELVGVPAKEARLTIELERPELRVQVVPPDTMVTMDFRNDRVRLWVDDNGIVDKTPVIG